MSHLSLLCLVSLSPSAILWPYRLLLRLLLQLDLFGGDDPLGVFTLFLSMVADIIAPKQSIIFRGFIRQGSFLECWQFANVTVIPMGASNP